MERGNGSPERIAGAAEALVRIAPFDLLFDGDKQPIQVT